MPIYRIHFERVTNFIIKNQKNKNKNKNLKRLIFKWKKGLPNRLYISKDSVALTSKKF